jgi:leucyl aminopeptidase
MREREVLYSSLSPSQAETDVLVLGAFEEGLEEEASRLDALLGGALEEMRREEMKGEVGETAFLRLREAEGVRARRICLVGLGKKDKLSPETLRRAAGSAARASRERGGRDLALALPAREDVSSRVRAVVEGAMLGLYRFPGYRSKPEEREVERLTVLGPEEGREAFEKGLLLARCTSLARDLTNEPANRLTPEIFARRAEEEAQKAGLEVEVWDEKRCEEEGMGAFLGVARGSKEPPRLVHLRYRAGEDIPTLALVGKGITFDSGGISIKPSEGMDEMKMDMAGAAAVLAACLALPALRPRVNVWGLLPLTENMPGGRAQRPGDVVRACNGKTIEVANTDAEGRLILADAVAWAVKGGAGRGRRRERGCGFFPPTPSTGSSTRAR